MPAPEGNDFAKKLKDYDTKQLVYSDYCNHLSQGKSQKSWRYKKDGLTLTSETIEKYIKTDDDFDPIHKDIAKAEGLSKWEEMGVKMMTGEYEKCQPAIFQMFMRNMYSWDRNLNDPVEDQSKSTTVKIINFADAQLEDEDDNG